MTEEQTPIKIVIPVEEEAPFVPEPDRLDVKVQVRHAGRQITRTTGKAAKRAWRSPTTKRATGALKRGLKRVAAAGGRVMHGAVVKTTERQVRKRAAATRARFESTDWKHEAKTKTGRGLRWLSRRTAGMADRLTPDTVPEHDVKDS